MIKKFYGEHIITCKWTDGDGAIVNRCLEIYKLKNGFKGVLWDSGKKGWREEPNKPLEVFKEDNALDIIVQCVKGKDNYEMQNPPLHNYGTIKGGVDE